MENSKKFLRKYILQSRKNINFKQKKEMDYNISKKVLSSKAFHDADRILIYHSTPEEVDTKTIIEYSFLHGKKVFMPVLNEKNKNMDFYIARKTKKLTKNRFGIYEPEPYKTNLYKPNKNKMDLCIVPALAVDKRKYRLGYGAGYYDRFLNANPNLKTICLSYSLFSFEEIPVTKKDEKCSIIITD